MTRLRRFEPVYISSPNPSYPHTHHTLTPYMARMTLLRPHAEDLYAEELAALRAADHGPPQAARLAPLALGRGDLPAGRQAR